MTCYYPHPEGTQVDVYEMTVNIPPVGMVWDFLDGKWVQTEIYSRSDDPEDQYWERPIEIDYNKLRRIEKRKQQYNKLFIDSELEAIREREWFRRINGFWFMNNGVPTFITGLHYFYLTWWRIDVGYPNYRDSDRLHCFYLWSYCEGDPDSFGLVEAARRRSGKTYRGGIIQYEAPSRTIALDNFCTIQRKTRGDAQKVFSKMVNGFKALPDFFKPIYDTSGGIRPKNVLTFLAKSSRAADAEDPEVELGAQINYESYEILAPDGTRQLRYMRDESGKTELADVAAGWDIVKPCLLVGTRTIVGKAFYTTTIEEGGSINFKRLWNDCNFQERDPDTGRTRAGMYRVFVPAYKNDADFTDKYGNCDEEASKDAMMKERRALAAYPKKLAGYIRKNPFTIKEAFYSVNDECIYDSIKLNQQLDAISYKKEKDLYVRGNFQWEDGIGTDVKFIENFNGLWKMHRAFYDLYVDGKITVNGYQRLGDNFMVNSKNIGVTGADTFDHAIKNISDENQASNAAFLTYWRHDPLFPALSDTFVCQYIHRADNVDLMAEDLLKQAVFFGTPVICESNKPGAISYFERMGYRDFIIKVDSRQGIAATNKNKQSLAEVTEIYIDENITNVVFEELLLDWNQFSLKNSTAYDAAMGSGWALLIATRIGKSFQQKPEHLEKKPVDRGVEWWSRHL
jgi:hypothetical protein